MPIGELYINNKDAYDEWGVSMDSSALSALMSPPPMKSYVENKSALTDGKQVLVCATFPPKVDERNITLTINLTANNETQFFARYASFCAELEKSTLDIRTKYQPSVIYHTKYVSCSQFTQFMRGMAKFSLKLNEPNPKNRS